MNQHVIRLNKHSNIVAEATLRRVEQEVKEIRSRNKEIPIILDFEGTSFVDAFIERLASICAYQDCRAINLSGREENIAMYLQMGYFERMHLGHNAFIEKFKLLVERADYPLLIWDKRNMSTMGAKYSIIQPITFTSTQFIFKELRGKYTQPRHLREAMAQLNEADIFIRNEVHLSDIDNYKMCFRFACTKRERAILDIIEGVLSRQLDWLMD